MYLPKRFTENDRAVALAVIEADGFATVFTGGSSLEASHVPTLIDDGPDGLSIEFHLARANPQCRQLEAGAECLVVYLGPHAYVSPSWYSEHPNVPTWNYLSVQATGPVSILGSNQLEAQLAALTARHEPRVGGDWSLAAVPTDYKTDLLAQIRGFRMRVTQLQAKSKLSQNRIAADRANVTRKLLESADPGAQGVGQWMAKKFGQPPE